jgi:hypothetical protein
MVAAPWSASASVSSGASPTYVVAQEFNTTNRRVFVCATGGTTGSTEPVWDQTPGGTTNDGGTVVWTEASTQFNAGTFTPGIEPIAAEYARASFDNSVPINFGDPNIAAPNPIVQWPTAVGNWGNVVGLVIADAPTGGNVYAWGLTTISTSVAGTGTASIGPAPSMSLSQGFVQGIMCGVQVPAITGTGPYSTTVTNVPSGGTILLAIPMTKSAGSDPAISSITDTLGGSVALVFEINEGASSGRIEIWEITGCAQGNHVLTITLASTTNRIGVTAFAYMGARTIVEGANVVYGGGGCVFVPQAVTALNTQVIIASNVTSEKETTNPAGPWVQLAGPLGGGAAQVAGLIYQFTSVPTLPGGWRMFGGAQYLTAGVLVT